MDTLAPRQGGALSKGLVTSLCAHQGARLFRVALRQEQMGWEAYAVTGSGFSRSLRTHKLFRS